MPDELEVKSLRAFRAYVTGDAAEVNVFSELKGVPRDEAQRLFARHRRELESIDPARSLILESIL